MIVLRTCRNIESDDQDFHIQLGLEVREDEKCILLILIPEFLLKMKLFMPGLCTENESYPQTLLLQRKDKGLVIIWVQVSHFNSCLFFLANSFSFTVKQFNLYVGV